MKCASVPALEELPAQVRADGTIQCDEYRTHPEEVLPHLTQERG